MPLVTVTHQQTLQDLRLARARLNNGWTKGTYGASQQETGGVCSLGAVNYALHVQLPVDSEYAEHVRNRLHAAARMLARHIPPYASSSYMQVLHDRGTAVNMVAGYNDNGHTRFDDIVRMFDGAIAELEQWIADDIINAELLTPAPEPIQYQPAVWDSDVTYTVVSGESYTIGGALTVTFEPYEGLVVTPFDEEATSEEPVLATV